MRAASLDGFAVVSAGGALREIAQIAGSNSRSDHPPPQRNGPVVALHTVVLCPMKSSRLWKDIAVIRLDTNPDGNPRYGDIFELPRGAEVDVYGAGFSERTVKLRWQGESFVAFLQDLESPG